MSKCNKYTKEMLIQELKRFVKENNRIPLSHEMVNKNGYPSYASYQKHFGSWNGALLTADLFPMRMKRINEKCSICEGVPSKTSQWYIRDGSIICNKCYQRDRYRIIGTLNPNCATGLGIITEYIVLSVLNNIINLNDIKFNGPYDLYNEQYGYINVKSSTLRKDLDRKNYYYWAFTYHKFSKLPDTYVCIGLSFNKKVIKHVWIIPKKSNLITKRSITISNSTQALKRAIQYEVDPTPYNEVYQNLDIYTLPEFCNLKHEE